MLIYTIAILLLTICGASYALYMFIQQNADKPIESKTILLDKFNHAKKLNRELIQKVQDYAEKHQVYDEHFMEDLTFQKCLHHLQKVNDQFFNEEYETIVKNENYSKESLDQLNQQIQKQVSRHIQINNSLNWYSKG